MSKKIALPLAAALLLSIAAAPFHAHHESFLPPNSLKHPIRATDNKGITQDQFNAVMDRIQALYGPIIAAKGGHLVINRLWTDDTVNASAEQQGGDWILNMYGGLARDPSITQDGMALVACHEMGHHLGGSPKIGGAGWASNEGEADYFANSKCLHRMFNDPGAMSFTRVSDDDKLAAAACAKSYSSAGDRAVCVREAAAANSVTVLLSSLGGEPVPHFDSPDASVVTAMNDDHPASQCRLDTYYQATLCPKSYKVDMDDNDPAAGACVKSQGYTVGMRPLCWYFPPAGETGAPSAAVAKAMSSHVVKSEALASLNDGVFSGL